MPDGLYDRDVLAWAEKQSALLERLAAGERVNALLDWPHVIEEVRDVGVSELRSCRSLLTQALVHLLKLHGWPESLAVPHWRAELAVFLTDAQDRYVPSMRQKIDMAGLYGTALYRLTAEAEALGGARALPPVCPYILDDLVADKPDLDALIRRLRPA